MHPNPAFRRTERARSLAAARDRGFGTLCLSADPLPLTAHLPFVLSADGARLNAHLVRSNPIASALADGPRPAVMSVLALDAYISPDWYGQPDQVPTWNYVAIRLEGRLSALPDAALHGHLESLSDLFESRLLPKAPWHPDKMSAGVMARMMRMILPVELQIENVESTWKLSQNKSESARLAAAAALLESDEGAAVALLSDLMRNPPEAV